MNQAFCLLQTEGLVQIAQLLRQYHEAVAKYTPLRGAVWRIPDAHWQPGMIIRHGDLGPWNMVWNDGILTGLIDWDFATPGYPVDDVAEVAWYCVPLRPAQRCAEAGVNPDDVPHRFATLCEAYGIAESEVIAALINLQQSEIARTQQLGSQQLEPWATFKARGDVEEMTNELNWLRQFSQED